MGTTNESSVMMALGELKRLEAERIAEQQAAVASKRAEDQRRRAEAEAAAWRQAELDRARVALEAKLRVDAEVSRDRSLDDLRARVAAVQAEREALSAALRERVARAGEPAPTKPGAWALAFGLSSVVAAALAGVLVVQQQRPIEIVRTVHEPIVATHVPAPVVEEIVAPAIVAPIAVAPEPTPVVRVRDRDRVRDRVVDTRVRVDHEDIARDLGFDDEEDEDVLTGIEHAGSGARRH